MYNKGTTKASNSVFAMNSGDAVRDKSEKAVQNRENYKKMNAVKRISRNSIVLFSFTGRNKNKNKEEASKTPASAISQAAKEE